MALLQPRGSKWAFLIWEQASEGRGVGRGHMMENYEVEPCVKGAQALPC